MPKNMLDPITYPTPSEDQSNGDGGQQTGINSSVEKNKDGENGVKNSGGGHINEENRDGIILIFKA